MQIFVKNGQKWASYPHFHIFVDTFFQKSPILAVVDFLKMCITSKKFFLRFCKVCIKFKNFVSLKIVI